MPDLKSLNDKILYKRFQAREEAPEERGEAAGAAFSWGPREQRLHVDSHLVQGSKDHAVREKLEQALSCLPPLLAFSSHIRTP